MKIRLLSFCCFVVFATVVQASPIVADGEANAQIVIGDQPTRTQRLAADQLQAYIRKISGAELPITTAKGDLPVTLYVGRSAATDAMGLSNEELTYGAYRMVSGEDYLVLLGRDTNFWMDKPGDGGPEFPRNRGDRDRAKEAWHAKHGDQYATPFMSFFKGYNSELGIWLQDQRGSLNAVNDFLRSLGVRWYMPGDFGEVLPQQATIELPQVDRTVHPEWKQRQMLFYFNAPFMASRDEFLWQLRLGLNADGGLGGHGIAYMLYPEVVKEQHPEYYALYGDRRETESRGGKPCHSSEGLLQASLGFARLMNQHYDDTMISLMPTDGYTYFCQCELCEGKDTPQRGYKGIMSDYVWNFINRAAEQIATTDPEIMITNYAYSTFLLPPEQIEQFHPNVAVGICQHRTEFHDPEAKAYWRSIRNGYLEKVPSGKISLWEYYTLSRGGIPGYTLQIIAEDLRDLKGKINGTMIEVPRARSSGRSDEADPSLASNHLNLWLTARLWWDPDQDVDAMLAEYYRTFYGPAAAEMQAFVEHCEQTWPQMRSQAEPIEEAFRLIEIAKNAAGDDNLYAARVQLLIDYMQPMQEILAMLQVGRDQNPQAIFGERDAAQLTLDGKLDDSFWQGLPVQQMRDLVSGEEADVATTFQIAWADGALIVGVRCEEPAMADMVTPAGKDGDNLIFSGDSIELLLESPTHAYYQLAIDPQGYVNDVDRVGAGVGKKGKVRTVWDAGLEVATHQGDDFWSAEIRVPVLGANQEELNPDYGVSGDKPTKEAPWYFNFCRVRHAGDELGFYGFSPTGQRGFHDLMKFGQLVPQ